MDNNEQRAAIYIRCARQDQGAADEQRKECRKYIEQQGYVFAGEYADMGTSGLTNTRSGLDAITVEAHIGAIDKIVVASMARLSRSAKDAQKFCHDLKESCGVVVEAAERSARL